MKIRLILIAMFAVFGFCGVAQADDVWRADSEQDDESPRSSTCTSITRFKSCYHTYTGADTDSTWIWLTVGATLCVDPDITTTGSATAQVRLRRINVSRSQFEAAGDKTTVSSIVSVGATSILTGDDTVNPQLACMYSIPPGLYYVESTTAPTSQDVVVSFTGN